MVRHRDGKGSLWPIGATHQSSAASLGLLALGSPDRDRFHPGMSTEFLARLAELVTDSLRGERTS